MINKLDKLKNSHSMINLVFILSFNSFYVDETLDLFSTSINHVVISGLKIVSGDQLQDFKLKLTKFLNDSSVRTMVTISYCTRVLSMM
jgi:hypothetical protein